MYLETHPNRQNNPYLPLGEAIAAAPYERDAPSPPRTCEGVAKIFDVGRGEQAFALYRTPPVRN